MTTLERIQFYQEEERRLRKQARAAARAAARASKASPNKVEAPKIETKKPSKEKWTWENFNTKDPRKMSEAELRRALNWARWRVNKRIDNLINLEKTEDIESPALKYIREPIPKDEQKKTRSTKGQGHIRENDELKTVQQLRSEFARVRYFINLSTSSVEETRKWFNRRKKIVSELIKSDIKKMSNTEVSNFYKLFRYYLQDKDTAGFESGTKLSATMIVFNDKGRPNIEELSFKDELNKKYEEIYESDQQEQEAIRESIENGTRMR